MVRGLMKSYLLVAWTQGRMLLSDASYAESCIKALRPGGAAAAAETLMRRKDSLDLKSKEEEDSFDKISSQGIKCLRGRRCQFWRLILLPFIPILALIVQTTIALHTSFTNRQEVSDVEGQVNRAEKLAKMVTMLQMERSEVAFFVFTNGSTLRSNLSQRFNHTDRALHQMELPPLAIYNNAEPVNRTVFIMELVKLREQIVTSGSHLQSSVVLYTKANAALIKHLTKEIKETDGSTIWRYLIGFKNLLRSIETMGIASVLGINYFGRGNLSRQQHISFIAHHTLYKDLLDSTLNLVPNLIPLHTDIMEDSPTSKQLEIRTQMILNKEKNTPSLEDAIEYFDKTATYLDKLRSVQKRLRTYIREGVAANLFYARQNEFICASILILVCVVSPILIMLVRNAVNTIQMYAMDLSEKASELEREKELSDSLLYQMLPPSVATQLKQTQQVPAEYFESVTVYFSDIVGFTEMAAASTPYQVITFLNSVYKMFDARIECYDVYKIETIGDSYMVASGLPERNGDKHASEIASMALDLLDAMSKCHLPHRADQSLAMRCGIHVGPCVAGIVGTKMPRYCLFGDTINTASRMESTGEPRKIQITRDVKRMLDETAEFKIVPRGLVHVKGKGKMHTYWLLSKIGGKPPPVPPPTYNQDNTPDFLKRLHSIKRQTSPKDPSPKCRSPKNCFE